MTIYIKHAGSDTVHSVSEDHYDRFLTEKSAVDGQRFPKPGIDVIDAEEAERLNPQLFGAHDPQIVFTPAELVAQATYQRQLKELLADHEANRVAAKKG